jgi:hypothetical protein
MNAYLNVAHILGNRRKEARNVKAGPVVAVVGPNSCGKTSLIKILVNYAIRSGWNPLLVETDVRHGMITIPGALSAVQASFSGWLSLFVTFSSKVGAPPCHTQLTRTHSSSRLRWSSHCQEISHCQFSDSLPLWAYITILMLNHHAAHRCAMGCFGQS